jgi:electron transport complex protein RnfC
VTSLFQQIKSGMLWDFHGGIHPPARKTQTSQKPLGRLNLPDRLYIPLRQHIGVAGKQLVNVGDYVLKGQALTAADNAMAVPVHAPTSGHIIAIEEHPSAHPSALPEPMIVLVTHHTATNSREDPRCGYCGNGGRGLPHAYQIFGQSRC